MIAAENGHQPTVKRLVEGGADVNHQNRVRKTCLGNSVPYLNYGISELTLQTWGTQYSVVFNVISS